MPTRRELVREARALAGELRSRRKKIVFAESCTGGLLSSLMTEVPGISEHYCGSAVVYRLATKARWLGIERARLDDPGPVSEIVARQMAEGVLARTPEADLAAAVTGHLGPHAPPSQDGLVYVAVALRAAHEGTPPRTEVLSVRLEKPDSSTQRKPASGVALRHRRRLAAAGHVLALVREGLSGL